MKLTKIVKWNESQSGNCPAFYQADNGDIVVQGWQLDPETRGNLDDLASDEDAVRIPASLVADLIAQGR